MKSRSKARTKLHSAVCDNFPVHSYAAKRFSCPGCQGKCWAQILNYKKENRAAIIGYALLMAFSFYLGASGNETGGTDCWVTI